MKILAVVKAEGRLEKCSVPPNLWGENPEAHLIERKVKRVVGPLVEAMIFTQG